MSDQPGGRGLRMPRGRALVVAIVAVVALVYAGVVALYALNERTVTVVGCDEAVPDDVILLSLSPTSVDAAADRIAATLTVVSFGSASSRAQGIPDEDLTLLVSGTDAARSFTFEGGEVPTVISLRFVTDGTIERWPFDAHTTQFAALMVRDVDGVPMPIPTRLCASVHVSGWEFSSVEVAGTGTIVIDDEPVDEVRLTADRSAATVAFGLIILGLMIVMPVLGLTVAIRVYRGERKAEASLMSWMAAMLFATIPLRNFLPGSPPIGSWVDYLVVLWVVAALIASLVIYAIGWLKWAPRGDRPAG